MASNDLYPRFSDAEFARRHAAARALMAAEGVDALVVYGNSGMSRHNHADIHYLSGFLGNRNNYVVLPAHGRTRAIRAVVQPRAECARGFVDPHRVGRPRFGGDDREVPARRRT